MKQKISARFFSGLITLLGFGAVVGCEDGGDGALMYGTLRGKFEYKAKVVDRTNAPMEGVLITAVDSHLGSYKKPPFDNRYYVKTDANGVATQKSTTLSSDSVFLFVHDPAGRFADTLCGYKVQPAELSSENAGNWSWGLVTKSVEIEAHTAQ